MRSSSTFKMMKRAMHLDDSRLFRLLLEKEGWPTDSEWSDYELLIYAIKSDKRRITHLLLDKGARVKKDNVKKLNSPLHAAAVKKTPGWAKVIGRLLARGASVDFKNCNSDTALHAAFKSHAPSEIVDMLLLAHVSKSSMDVYNREGLGFIHIACTRTNLEAVRELLDDHSLVNVQVHSKCITPHAGYTPLHFAVEHGRLEIAEYLLKNGGDIYRQNINGSTPLHFALESRNIEMIDLLLSHDILKVKRVNNFGLSHFMAVCAGSNQNLIDAYLQKALSFSALIDSRVQDIPSYPHSSYSPLHFAAAFGRQRIVELLLSRGADCCALARNGVTPHVLAHQGGHEKIACLLSKQCRIYQSSTELSKVLGNRYVPIIDQDNQGNIKISFEKKDDSNDTDFSSEFKSFSEESTKSDNTKELAVTQSSHEDLVSISAKNRVNRVAKQVDIQATAIDLSQSSKTQFVDSQTVEPIINNDESQSEPLDLSKRLFSNSSDISSLIVSKTDFEEMPSNSFSRSYALSLYRGEAMQSQCSTLRDFSSFNPVASSTFYHQSASESSCFDRMDSIPDFVDEIPSIQTSTESSNFIQVSEVYAIPWSSFSSQNNLDFTIQLHTTGNVSQNDFYNESYQASFSNPYVSQSSDSIDYSGFFNAPSSTPNDTPSTFDDNDVFVTANDYSFERH